MGIAIIGARYYGSLTSAREWIPVTVCGSRSKSSGWVCCCGNLYESVWIVVRSSGITPIFKAGIVVPTVDTVALNTVTKRTCWIAALGAHARWILL